jgi:hypothetical protein
MWCTLMLVNFGPSGSPDHKVLWGTLVEVTRSTRYFVQASDHSIEKWLDKLRSFKTTDPKDKVWIAFLLTQRREPIVD